MDGINPELVILKQEPGPRSPPALVAVTKPAPVQFNSPPPLVPVQSRRRVRVEADGPPRLVPTPMRRLVKTVKTSPRPRSKNTPAPNVHSSTTDKSVQSQVSASNTSPCLIGRIYNVSCHRKYLGAAHVLLDWSDLEPATHETILSKIRNQAKPEVSDSIFHHHIRELSYLEEPDPNSSDKDKGFCAGYGIVHKVPALTTRLGVLTYYNNLAGKNRDVLPGKFVCSTCIRILRGAPGSVTAAESSPAELGLVDRTGMFTREDTGSLRDASVRSFLTSTSGHRVSPYPIPSAKRDSGSGQGDNEDEEMEIPLQPSDITISGSYLGRNEIDQLDFDRDLKTEIEESGIQHQDSENAGDGDGAPQFVRLNAILAAAGVSPFLMNSDSKALKSQAIAKFRELVQNCVNILQEDGIELNVQSVFSS